MAELIARRPVWSFVILVLAALVLWLVFSVWTPGMEEMFGRKRVFIIGSAMSNGTRHAHDCRALHWFASLKVKLACYTAHSFTPIGS